MAVTHIVAFTWTEDTDAATVTAIDETLHAFIAAGEGLDGLVSWHGGRDLGLAQNAADYGVAAVFADRAAYERYRDHPEHRRIISEQITPHIAQRAATQFED